MLHGIGWQLVTDVSEQSVISVPSTVVKQSKKAGWTLKMGLTGCSEMFVTSCKGLNYSIAEAVHLGLW